MFARLACTLCIPLIAFLLAVGAGTAGAAELVMFERAGCPWCARWNREIGPIYPKTSEGQLAPLRRIDIQAGRSDLVLATPVRFTPTFVLADQGREVGRITGYMSEDFFWGLLTDMLARIPRREERPCNQVECP
jgi:hypothetical protein